MALTRDATRRLAVIEAPRARLRVRIASHDLEIRGAGNLLGKDQSGQIHQVGYEAVHAALSEAVAEISGKAASQEEPELELRVPAFLPDDYMDEAGERLEFYQLSSAKTVDAADEIDGAAGPVRSASRPRPRAVRPGADARRDALLGSGGAKRGDGSLFLTLSAHSPFDRAKLVSWVTRERKTFSFVRGEILAMRLPRPGSRGDPGGGEKNLLNRFGAGSSI